jgi:hypothetical protein
MWSFGATSVAIVLAVVTSVITLAGSYAHIAITCFLVIGVYVQARGIELILQDLRRIPSRLGIAQHIPATPVARDLGENKDEPEPYSLEDPILYVPELVVDSDSERA